MSSSQLSVRAFRPSRMQNRDEVDDSARQAKAANMEKYSLLAQEGLPLFEPAEEPARMRKAN